MTDNTDLTDRVEPDTALSGAEKETTISMYGDEQSFRIYSAKPTIVRDLLSHDHFEIARARGAVDGDHKKAQSRDRLADFDAIYSVVGRMPVGCLTIKSKPRKQDYQSGIISTETVSADAFEDDD